MKFKITIDGQDMSHYVILPVKWNALLDERLDEGRLSLRVCPVELFPIGAPVVISVDGEEIGFIVSADTSTEMPVGSGKYSHELSVIEPTKALERVVVETLTFTNSLGRTYVKDVKYLEPIWNDV